MFGHAAALPVDLILGVPSTSAPHSQLDHIRRTVENLSFAYGFGISAAVAAHAVAPEVLGQLPSSGLIVAFLR